MMRPLRLKFFFLVWAVFFTPLITGAQDLSQVPQRLYVGDRGRLIITLGPEFRGLSPFVAGDIRLQGDVRIHRLELERRQGIDRLLIDFTAYTPGLIALPPFIIPQMPGFKPESYTVTIASILEGSLLVLSNPAPPLAVPGTSLLIYGTSSLIALVLLASLALGIWGRPYLAELLETHRRRRLIALMRKIGVRLGGKLPQGGAQGNAQGRAAEILRELSTEYRSFLGYFSGRDCRAMTATEFFSLPPLFAKGGENSDTISPPSLGLYFRTLDRLRFSGEPIEVPAISALLDVLNTMLNAMDSGLREEKRPT